jgi:hypothetical protein
MILKLPLRNNQFEQTFVHLCMKQGTVSTINFEKRAPGLHGEAITQPRARPEKLDKMASRRARRPLPLRASQETLDF